MGHHDGKSADEVAGGQLSRRSLLKAGTALATLGTTSLAGCTGGPQYTQWPMGAVDAANTGFNPRTQFPALELSSYADTSVPNARPNPPVTAENRSYVTFSDGTIYGTALDVDEGVGRTEFQTTVEGSPTGSPALGDGGLFVTTEEGYLHRVAISGSWYGPDEGETVWTYPESGRLEGTPAGGPTFANGRVVLATDRAIHVVGEDGDPKATIPTSVTSTGSPAVRDGVAYVGGPDGVEAVRIEGERRTLWRTDQPVEGRLVAGRNRLFGTDPSAGQVVSIARRTRSGAVDETGTTTPSGTDSDVLPSIGHRTPYSYPNATLGTVEWRSDADTHATPRTPPTLTPATVLVGTDEGVAAVEPSTGAWRWEWDDAGVPCLQPMASGGMVYVVDTDGILHVLDGLSHGEEVASFDTERTPDAPPTVFFKTVLQAGREGGHGHVEAVAGTGGAELLTGPVRNKLDLAGTIDETAVLDMNDEEMATSATDLVVEAVEANELSVGTGREAVRRLQDAERLSRYALGVHYGGLTDSNDDGMYDQLDVPVEGPGESENTFLEYDGSLSDDSENALPLIDRTALYISSFATDILMAVRAPTTLAQDVIIAGAQTIDGITEDDASALLGATNECRANNDPLDAFLTSALGGVSDLEIPFVSATTDAVLALETAHTNGIEAAIDYIDTSPMPDNVADCLTDLIREAPSPMMQAVPGVGNVLVADYILDVLPVVKECLAEVVRPLLVLLAERGCGYEAGDHDIWPDLDDALRFACHKGTSEKDLFGAFDAVTIGKTLRRATNTESFDRLKRYDRLPGTRTDAYEAFVDGVSLMRNVAQFCHTALELTSLDGANDDGKHASAATDEEILEWTRKHFGNVEDTNETAAVVGYRVLAAVFDIVKGLLAPGISLGQAILGLGSIYSINHAHSIAAQGVVRGKTGVDHL